LTVDLLLSHQVFELDYSTKRRNRSTSCPGVFGDLLELIFEKLVFLFLLDFMPKDECKGRLLLKFYAIQMGESPSLICFLSRSCG
jgi:hypothetical protein